MSSNSDLFEQTPFWGPITSSIDWCEPNYQMTRFVAEPLNTVSNLSFVLFGLLGAFHEYSEKSKQSYITMYLTVAFIGIGSMLFHGTLTVWGQQADELPMVWHLLMCMFNVNRESFGGSNSVKLITSVVLGLYAVVFSVIHIILKTTTAFQIHFGVLIALLLGRLYQKFRFTDPGPAGRKIILLFLFSGFFAFGFWLLDYHKCSWVQSLPFNPHGHVIWHLSMGYSAYLSVVMLKVLESQQGGKKIDVIYKFGLPFAHRIRTIVEPDVEGQIVPNVGPQLF